MSPGPIPNPSGLGSLGNEADLIRFIERQLGGMSLQRVQTALRGLANPEAWHEVGAAGPAFQNSWVNFYADGNKARFRKDPFGVVHLEGIIKDGTMNATAWTLPVGYRPVGREHYFSTPSNGAHGITQVTPAGAVLINVGSNVWVDVNGISFKAEQ